MFHVEHSGEPLFEHGGTFALGSCGRRVPVLQGLHSSKSWSRPRNIRTQLLSGRPGGAPGNLARRRGNRARRLRRTSLRQGLRGRIGGAWGLDARMRAPRRASLREAIARRSPPSDDERSLRRASVGRPRARSRASRETVPELPQIGEC